ncbi:MAG: polysaccharide biosynthesis protein, partial [Planctomycetota bacterium]
MISRSHLLPRPGNLALLSILSAGGYLVAYLLRFAGDLSSPAAATLHRTLAFAVLLKVVAAIWFRVPQGWSRYVTFHDLLQIAKASTCASIGLTLLDALALPSVLIPRSVLMLDWGASILLLSTVRCLPRAIRDSAWTWSRDDAARALIVGVNDSGEALLREIRGRRKRAYDPIGFIDAGDRYLGRRIGGVPVLGGLADAAEVIAKYRIDEVLISSGGLAGKQVRSLMDCAGKAGARVTVLPSYEQLLRQQVQIQPRPVAIADLLRRPTVQLDDVEIRKWLRGRTLLVTGASGSIGSEICRQLLRLSPAKLLLLDRSETAQFFLERELRL